MVITVYYTDASMDVFFNAVMSYELDKLMTINYAAMTHYPNYMAIKKTEEEIYKDCGHLDPVFYDRFFENDAISVPKTNDIANTYRTIMYIPVDRVLKIKAAPDTMDEVTALWAHNTRIVTYPATSNKNH